LSAREGAGPRRQPAREESRRLRERAGPACWCGPRKRGRELGSGGLGLRDWKEGGGLDQAERGSWACWIGSGQLGQKRERGEVLLFFFFSKFPKKFSNAFEFSFEMNSSAISPLVVTNKGLLPSPYGKRLFKTT